MVSARSGELSQPSRAAPARAQPAPGKAITHPARAPPWQKIRTIQLDGKTIKLQIVRQIALLPQPPAARPQRLVRRAPSSRPVVAACAVGHRGAGALPDDHEQLLPRRARHHRRLRRDRLRVVQQREDLAARDRPVRVRRRQQAARGQQVRPHHEEAGRVQRCKGAHARRPRAPRLGGTLARGGRARSLRRGASLSRCAWAGARRSSPTR